MLYVLMIGMIPAIALIVYIYHLDSVEREPVGLIMKLFFLGGISTVIASLLEELESSSFRQFLACLLRSGTKSSSTLSWSPWQRRASST